MAGEIENGRRPVAVVDCALARDPRLSFRARGVALHILSCPPGSRVASADLARGCPGGEGRDAVRRALRELEIAGYLVCRVVRHRSGQLETRRTLHDQPQPATDFQAPAPKPEKPAPARPAPAHPATGFSGAKSCSSDLKTTTTATTTALAFPPQLPATQLATVARIVAALGDDATRQAVLDELAGALASATPPRRPIAWLQALVERARQGTFTPDLAIAVQAARHAVARAVEADAERQRRADAEAARRNDPGVRARTNAAIAAAIAALDDGRAS